MLNYDRIKSPYRLIAVDLSRKEELHANPRSIQQIKFVGQLKKIDNYNYNATDAGINQSMFVLAISRKIKETRSKFSQGGVTVL